MKYKGTLFYLFISLLFLAPVTSYSQVNWKVKRLVKNGRIDAIADLGDGVVIAGTRWPNPGMIFRSTDYGITWKKVKTIKLPKGTYRNNQILCLMNGSGDYAYLLTANAQFWRSGDEGLTWKRTAQLGGKLGVRSFSYSICVTPRGTVLASSGHSIYRSTDNGLHFKKIGPVSGHYLYRLQRIGSNIFANGWNGTLYKSSDDGKTWQAFLKLGPSTDPSLSTSDLMKRQPYLTAIDSLGGKLLQGTMRGENYIVDPHHPSQLKEVSKVKGSLDDYAYLGYNSVIASTFYNGKITTYITYNRGKRWQDIGPVPTGVKGDWLDHVIRLNRKDSVIAIAGTHYGFIARAAFSLDELSRLSNLAINKEK